MVPYNKNLPNFPGPQIPQGCDPWSMVTLPSGSEAVLVGCYNGSYSESIYKLTWQGEHLQWVTLPEKLKYPRGDAVAMLIPDSMIDCN